MTTEQWLEQIHGLLTAVNSTLSAIQSAMATQEAILNRLQFLCHVTAIGVAWMAGAQSVKLWIYFKNHKDIW